MVTYIQSTTYTTVEQQVPQWAAAMPPRVFVYFVFLS
jgi:hypothetical protein